ncbi:MAG: transglutaminase domain-containing protein [Myxococcota bacterium]
MFRNAMSLMLPLVTAVACSRPEPATRFTFDDVPPGFTTLRQLRSTYTLRNTTGTPIPGASLWVYVPVQETSYQALKSVEFSHPALLQKGMAQVVVELPPYGTKLVRVDFDVMQAAEAQVASVDAEDFLRPSPVVEATHPDVVARAKELKKDNVLATARAIHEFVAGHVREGGYDTTERGALYALQNQSGDCSEYSSLFVALARAAGVPSRRVSGYFCEGPCRNQNYHTWAEFHDGERWRLVDSQNKRFDVQTAGYVALELNEETVEAPLLGRHRFAVVVPGAGPEGGPVAVETQTTID